ANFLAATPKLTTTSSAGTNSSALSEASFGPKISLAGLSGTIVAATDAAEPAAGSTPAGTTLDGCSAYANAGAVAGNIAIVNEGRCTNVDKAKLAQAAGATGLIIAAKAADTNIFTPIGFEPSITIGVWGMFKKDADTIRAFAGPVSGAVFPDLTKLTGADTNGMVKLYMPSVAEPGSTYSHFDKSATPNLLM